MPTQTPIQKPIVKPANPYFQKRDYKPPQTPYVPSHKSPGGDLAVKNQQQPKAEVKLNMNQFVRKPEPQTTNHSQQPAPNPPQDYKPTPEQKALLHYILQMKFMTFDQIERKFLNNPTSAQSFRSLFAYGFLKSRDEERTPQGLVVPTEKAYNLLKVENPEKEIPKANKRVFEPAVKHDLKLVELRFRFEELNYIKNWYSEKSLAEVPLMNRLFQDLPDAVCKKPNDKGYFLELEISQKSQKTYEERIAHYIKVLDTQEIQEQGIEGVIFLCTDEKVYKIIKSKIPKSKAFSVLMLERYLKPSHSTISDAQVGMKTEKSA